MGFETPAWLLKKQGRNTCVLLLILVVPRASNKWMVFLCVCVCPEQIYTDWANHYLAKSGHKRFIKDLQTDVTDGVLLAEIIQVVGKGYTLLTVFFS